MRMPPLFVFCLTVTLTGPAVRADVRLPAVFGDQMVLQRDAEVPVWGWADAGESVTVRLGDSSVQATAGADGRWQAKLPRQPAGGPHTLVVSGKNEVKLTDVLIGEVWVCSGQSNMEWHVARSSNAEQEIKAASYPKIRLFHIPRRGSGEPLDDVEAAWKSCTPENIPTFSAVSYFFGRHLHKELDVPIGLINTSWGGTRIEPWTPPAGFEAVSDEEVQSIGETTLRLLDKYREQVAAARKAKQPMPKDILASRGTPMALYNGMVHGIVPFGIRGAIWYQGEANRADGLLYGTKMEALIKGWRSIWKQGDFPFYYVQLAPYQYRGAETMLPNIWEAQRRVLALNNTGMAVTTDITTLRNIHPPNKQDVGKRLALWALAKTYARNELVYSGPLYRGMKIEGSKIRLQFDHVGSGLVSRDGKPLSWFTIAGKDGNYVEAKAEIDGETVLVSSDKVESPTSVRLGWHQLAEPNLMNKDGLPASPFQAGP